ncbi:MAG: LD-carboxypeptidase, partial [Spirochaetaceae bacterium]|nr:LD-carboxypeptidase [Spirochaetaceae bacterium]
MALKPKALRRGDRIALAAPSGSLKESAQADAAVAMLRRMGFEVVEGSCCRESYGYLAGSDAMRAAELNSFFADPTVAGIVCLKGGYGTPRILDALDYGAIRSNPKVFVGYSDITGIHLALNKMCGMVSFHGPMARSDALLDGEIFSVRSWMAALTSSSALGVLEAPEGAAPLERLVGGTARGPIVGGNLSLVAALAGTPYALDARGKILFFEDINEAPYRVDRMLTQLRLAGAFDACAGVLLGDWNACVP